MEDTELDGGISGFHLNCKLSDIKPDLGSIPISSGVKDVGTLTFRGRSFRVRDAEELLRLRRDLANIKIETQTMTVNDRETDTEDSTYAVLSAKIEKLAKILEEVRGQLQQSNGARTQSSMERLQRLQTKFQENIVSMDMKQASGPGPQSLYSEKTVNFDDAESQNGTEIDKDEEQSPINSNAASAPMNNQPGYTPVVVPNYNIDITVLPGKPAWYRCNICQKRFTLKAHIMNHDNCQKGENLIKCQQCGRDFISKSHYEYHVRLHERQLKGHERSERVGTYKGPRFFLPPMFY